MKVSVIIPVFNAEKFLGACLESILNQTLKDFEVIIVDDCSTDNSIVVAENFLERFCGRLKIFSTEKNSGSGSVPRDVGLKFSRGEYIFFMDNDDLLVPDALETLYNLAENFRAEVVYMSRGFVSDGKTFAEAAWDKNISALDKPTLETENISERVENFFADELRLGSLGKIFAAGFSRRQQNKFSARENFRGRALDVQSRLPGEKIFARAESPLHLAHGKKFLVAHGTHAARRNKILARPAD